MAMSRVHWFPTGMQMKRNMYYDALVKANWSEKAAEEALLAQRKAGAGSSSKGKKKGGKSKSRLNAGGNHNAAGIDGAEAAGGAAAAAAALRQQQRASPPKRPRLSSTGGSGHKSLLRQFKVIGESVKLVVLLMQKSHQHFTICSKKRKDSHCSYQCFLLQSQSL